MPFCTRWQANFNDGSIPGTNQSLARPGGFLDQKDGMTEQLNALSNMGFIEAGWLGC